VNPRVRAGSKAAVFQVLTEANFITPEDHRSSIIYRDYFTRMDIPYICLTNIIQEREMLIGLTVNRSRREGHANDDVRRTLAAIAPHVRMAVRAQIALEGQGAQLIAGAFEALSIAAFVCDSACRVLARTPVTDTLIGADQPLALKGGRLTAAAQPNATALTEAVAATALRMQPSMSAIVLRRDPPHAPLILDVAPLPRRAHGFSFEAQVLIVARMARSNNIEKIALMRAVFGLTQAEAEVACALLRGETIAAVSQSRGASENTIRAQTKAIYDKMGVTNRAEFAAHLGQFA
jgi:DNA-binding CsgD family transcriptional regulator